MKLLKIFCFCSILCLMSCGNAKEGSDPLKTADVMNGYIPSNNAEKMKVGDYVSWIQDPENGFKKEKTIDDITFTVLFKPYEYIICQEEKSESVFDTLLTRKISELNGMQYFDLKIGLKEEEGELLKYKLSSASEYSDRVNYFAFQMNNDIKLVDGKDTVECSLFHFERAYDAAPVSTFLLGFPITNGTEATEKTIVIYDRTFNKGVVKFTFIKDELQKLPKLKTI